MTAFIFDATKVEPDQGRVGAMPKGWYKTMVEKTERKPTSDGTGEYISVMFGVIEGNYKGSKFFNNFNVVNSSEKAVEIGHKQFSALLHAVNVLHMTDTDQIKSIPFFTRLKFVEAEMETGADGVPRVKYEEKNEPSAYRNINDQAAIEAISKQQTGAGGNQAAAKAPQAPPQAPPVGATQQQWAQPQQQQQQPPQQPQQQQQWAAPVQQQPAPVQQQQQWAAPPQQQQQQQPAPVQQQAPSQAPAQAQPWQAPANAQPWQPQQQPVQEVQYQAIPNGQQQAAQQYSASPAQGQTAQPVPMQDPNAPPPWVQPQQ